MRALLDYFLTPLRTLISLPVLLVTGPRRFLKLSLPARLAFLLGLVLWIVTATFYIMYWKVRGHADFRLWFAFPRPHLIVILNLVIPVVAYQALLLWLQGVGSRFPDIDTAFRKGLEELQRAAIDIQSTPVFLVLGARDEEQAGNTFHAAGMNFQLNHVPGAAAALHWYASAEAIFIVSTEVGRTTRYARLLSRSRGRGEAAAADVAPAGENIRGTIIVGRSEPEGAGGAPRALEPVGDIRQSIVVSMFNRAADITRSILVGSGLYRSGAYELRADRVQLPKAEAALQSARLEHLCRLLRRERQPLCPLNGVLLMLPLELLQSSARDESEVELHVREDLAVVSEILQVRCPLVVMVAGMEAEEGFLALVRRLGTNFRKARFGKGCKVGNFPSRDLVETVALLACAQFEDHTYRLFQERDGFQKADNTKLYFLLCKVRHEIRERLTSLLSRAVACDARQGSSTREPLYFSGCYFAATGDADLRQAFVRGILDDKLIREEGDLAWTSEALESNRQYQRFAAFANLVSLALVTGFVWLFVRSKWK